MKRVSRHPVDLELIEEGIEGKKALLSSVLESSVRRPSALSLVLGTAYSYAGFLAAAHSDFDELCRALRIGARSAAAIFALATGSGEAEIDLNGASVRLPKTGPTDATHCGNWRVGWWFAHIVRDKNTIDRLAGTSSEVLRRSSTRADECQYLFIDALRAFETHANDWSTKLRTALDATDPEKFTFLDQDFVLDILVPEMQMLFRLAIGEMAPFNDALRHALERHKKYWSRANLKRDPNGYLAVGPLAIAAMARDVGMPIDVESDYLEVPLFEGKCKASQ